MNHKYIDLYFDFNSLIIINLNVELKQTYLSPNAERLINSTKA
jgi:hypothetical protein